jgi:hypothetical protein
MEIDETLQAKKVDFEFHNIHGLVCFKGSNFQFFL